MQTDFIYWRHILPPGIKIEEITGREDKSGEVWRTLAYQIYGENGKEGFRTLSHAPSGAPLLDGMPARVSVTHTDHLLAIATLPKTPEADLLRAEPRTALGIDAERHDRSKVLSLRSRFLSDRELALVPEDDLQANVMAWTAKEALFKAALTDGLDWKNDYRILSLPTLQTEFPLSASIPTGEAEIIFADGSTLPMSLFSYLSEDYIITVAYSPKCAKFKKSSR